MTADAQRDFHPVGSRPCCAFPTADVQRELADRLDEILDGLPDEPDAVGLAAALLPTVQALIADAEKRAAARAVAPFEQLFSGGPDTVCRTTWRDPLGGRAAEVRTTECVEVPMDDLRDAFDRAAALDPS